MTHALGEGNLVKSGGGGTLFLSYFYLIFSIKDRYIHANFISANSNHFMSTTKFNILGVQYFVSIFIQYDRIKIA